MAGCNPACGWKCTVCHPTYQRCDHHRQIQTPQNAWCDRMQVLDIQLVLSKPTTANMGLQASAYTVAAKKSVLLMHNMKPYETMLGSIWFILVSEKNWPWTNTFWYRPCLSRSDVNNIDQDIPQILEPLSSRAQILTPSLALVISCLACCMLPRSSCWCTFDRLFGIFDLIVWPYWSWVRAIYPRLVSDCIQAIDYHHAIRRQIGDDCSLLSIIPGFAFIWETLPSRVCSSINFLGHDNLDLCYMLPFSNKTAKPCKAWNSLRAPFLLPTVCDKSSERLGGTAHPRWWTFAEAPRCKGTLTDRQIGNAGGGMTGKLCGLCAQT